MIKFTQWTIEKMRKRKPEGKSGIFYEVMYDVRLV